MEVISREKNRLFKVDCDHVANIQCICDIYVFDVNF